MESILEGECNATNWLCDNQSNHFIVFNTLREREHWKSTRSDIGWRSGIEFEDKTPYDVLIGRDEISSINFEFLFHFRSFLVMLVELWRAAIAVNNIAHTVFVVFDSIY